MDLPHFPQRAFPAAPSRFGRGLTALPDWKHPPRAEGWFAEDLDYLPAAPRCSTVISSSAAKPQTSWHSHMVTTLTTVFLESARRDRTVKLRKYAEAGIPHYWYIQNEDGSPVVHVYELDEPILLYAPAGIFRGTLRRSVPSENSLDLGKLTPPGNS